MYGDSFRYLPYRTFGSFRAKKKSWIDVSDIHKNCGYTDFEVLNLKNVLLVQTSFSTFSAF